MKALIIALALGTFSGIGNATELDLPTAPEMNLPIVLASEELAAAVAKLNGYDGTTKSLHDGYHLKSATYVSTTPGSDSRNEVSEQEYSLVYAGRIEGDRGIVNGVATIKVIMIRQLREGKELTPRVISAIIESSTK